MAGALYVKTGYNRIISGVVQQNPTEQESRRLVERVAASRYVAKSARLRDLLVFLSDRALEGTDEIHEQEVGHKVFGRPADYDTVSDNIVRVHASTLRKRLEQYFSEEGASEPLILEIPKGNYAPVFRRREALLPQPAPEPPPIQTPQRDYRVPTLAVVACVFAVSTAVLLLRGSAPSEASNIGPTVRAFWSQIFRPGQTTDVVLDDASLGLYQELTGRGLSLSDYFDRSYLRTIPSGAAAAKIEPDSANAMVLRRHTSFASVSFLAKLFQFAGAESRQAAVLFARDYSFRALKSDNAILLGQARSNPWMEPFLPRIGIRWNFDKDTGAYYPVDTWTPEQPKVYRGSEGSETRESYCGISLLPNLGGGGNVLIVSATGGSAFNAIATFLGDESAMKSLRKSLGASTGFPHFEALLKVKGRSTQPRDAVIVICRPARSHA